VKLKEYSREQAKNFVIFWTSAFAVFSLLVIWTLISGFDASTLNHGALILWPHALLMMIIILSLLGGIAGMWQKYLAGEYTKVRNARNIAFYTVIIIFPVGILLNLLLAIYSEGMR